MLKFMLEITFATLIAISTAATCRAAHPLITDDAGTVGKYHFQVELDYQYSHEKDEGVKEDEHEIESILTVGLIDQVDLVVGLPYVFVTTREDGYRDREEGVGDLSLEVKWRFYECNGLSLAIKPGVSFPTGDDEREFGTGRVGAGAYFIATQEWEPLAFHFNVGYIRNENKVDERKDLYHVSLATEWEAAKWLKVVGNIGAEANTDRHSDTPAAFILGGVIIPVAEWLDLDVGIKGGLTEPEADYSLLAGMCFHF